MVKKNFDVIVSRDGKWWVFDIPALGAAGQALKLSDVEFEAHDVVATWLNVDPKTVTVTVSVDGKAIAAARGAWEEAERVDEIAREKQEQAAAMRRQVIRELRDKNYSATDVGDLLGISRQRVYQLEKAS